jgi:hypothetical protein
MLVYNLDTIQSISVNIDTFNINIDRFVKEYIQIEKNDKYEPVFSLTEKYKSFPVNSGRSTKNFFQNNKWKINNSNVLKINQDLKLALNKLSISNYDIIKSDLINILKDNITKDVLDIFMKELFEKIWFDENFLDMYVLLCYDLCNHKKINYDFNLILKYCKQEFNNREAYKIELSKTTTEELSFINKRKIIGTIEFICHLYIKEYVDNETIMNIINSLLSDNMNDLDYECFYKLWIIINKNNRLEHDIIDKYKEFIIKDIPNINNNRIRILLATLVEHMVFQKDNNNINYINECILEFKKTKDLSNVVVQFKALEPNLVINELIMNELENKTGLFIEVILLLIDKDKLIDILNSFDLDEVEIDIPNVRSTFKELKQKLKI